MASIIERHLSGCQSKIDTLWKQVLKTFKWAENGALQYDEENFTAMKRLVDVITAEDISLETSLSEMKQHHGFKSEDAVGNISVCGNDIATMQVFILHKDQKMPIHDHPRMIGILKVIKGCVRINSYTLQSYERQKPGSSILCTKKQTWDVCKSDPACVLTPTDNNFHSITALNGEAAFLDILSPPYFTSIPGFELNVCNYYRETSTENGDGIVRLAEIPPPKDYWTVRGEYRGPSIE